MADWIDTSVDQQERLLSAQEKYRKPAGPTATGFCLYCSEALPEHMRWCSTDCRDDWEAERGRGRVSV